MRTNKQDRELAQAGRTLDDSSECVAIVGVGLRLPNAVRDLEQLWQFLAAGRVAAGPIPPARFDLARLVEDCERSGRPTIEAASLLERIDEFDAGLFHISPREAKHIDPQHRLLLETSWEALEHAGIVPGTLEGSRAGVFIGIGTSDYDASRRDLGDIRTYVGTQPAFAAGRIAHAFGLRGPTFTVDTNCSSALVSLHLARRALLQGECDLALSGGVQLIIAPDHFAQFGSAGILAPDGRSKPFSALADGFGRGEGAVVIALERLTDARARGHRVLALIRGSAVVHNGADPRGIATPNGDAQAELVRVALADAGLEPHDIDAVECHGTGTIVGDPIELDALTQVFGPSRAPERPLLVGSAKANLGHLEVAAGMAGVVKLLTSLTHDALAPTAVSRPLNPAIDWRGIELIEDVRPWPASERPHRAGVSSFGLSGTNVHVILEQPSEAPATARASHAPPDRVPLLISARAAVDVERQLARLRTWIDERPSLTALELAHGLATTRTHFGQRLAVWVDADASPAELAAALADPGPSTRAELAPVARVTLAASSAPRALDSEGLIAELRARFAVYASAIEALEATDARWLERSAEHRAFAHLLGLTRELAAQLPGLEIEVADALAGLVHAHVDGRVQLPEIAAALATGEALSTELEPESEVTVGSAIHVTLDWDPAALIEGLVALHLAGVEVDWAGLYRPWAPATPELPTYAFRPERHWFRRPPEALPLVLASREPRELRAEAERLHAQLAAHPSLDLLDLAASLAATCGEQGPAAAVVASSREDQLAALRALAHDEDHPAVVRPRGHGHGQLAFVFPGQGSQWPQMARTLRVTHPGFRAQLDACEAAFAPYVDWSLSAVLGTEAGARELDRVDVVQPALFAVMVALAGVWRELGVEPDAVVGHSQGEVAAAYIAGVLSLDDAAKIVCLRSQVIAELSEVGGMAAITTSRAQIEQLLADHPDALELAVDNGPETVVLAGEVELLDTIVAQLTAAGAFARVIPISYASHSRWVEAARASMLAALADIEPQPATIPMFSTVDVGWIEGPELDAAYWYRNLRHRVRFGAAITELLAADYGLFVELAPRPILAAPMIRLFDQLGVEAAACATLRRDLADERQLMVALAELASSGYAYDFDRLFGPFEPRSIALPGPTPAAAEAATEVINDEFWAAVEREDLDELSATLDLDAAGRPALARLLPALSRHRQRELTSAALPRLRHALSWTPLPPAPAAAAPARRDLVVLADAGEAARALAEALADGGALVELDADADLDLDALLAEQLAAQPGFDAVISLLALDSRPDPEHPALDRGLGLELALIQALGRRRDQQLDAPPLWLLTESAVALDGDPGLAHPEQAMSWGLGTSLSIAAPEAFAGLLDLPAGLELDPAEVRAALSHPALAHGDDQLALRGGELLARRIVAAETDTSRASAALELRGPVLITGGTGALGAHFARWLVDHGVEELILVSRRGAAAPGAIELGESLALRGATVELRGCDVGEREAVAAMLDDLDLAGLSPRGIIHAAGVPGPLTPLLELGLDDFASVVTGKVAGARHLHELTAARGLELDFFVLSSSVWGVWGNGHVSAYASANAYLDALADHRRGRDLPALATAWGVWDGPGMGEDETLRRLDRIGLHRLSPAVAVSALGHSLAAGETRTLVADLDWDRFAEFHAIHRPRPQLDALVTPDDRARETPEGDAALVVAWRQLAPSLRLAELTRFVVDLTRTLLALPADADLDPRMGFSSFGIDSLMAVELRTRIERQTHLAIPATVVFEHPSPEALARYLLTRIELVEAEGSSVAAAPASARERDDDPIAIVGIGLRMPGGAVDLDSLWTVLELELDTLGPVPRERWSVERYYDPDPDAIGKCYVREAAYLDHIDRFDPAFFNISPREAARMDPQHRMMLEATWEALERAGVVPATLRSSATGVFVGLGQSDYEAMQRAAGAVDAYTTLGTHGSFGAGRIAFTLGVQGPAMTVDTACSSALVALHLALRSLREGECELAIAASAQLMASPEYGVQLARTRALAPDGRSKTFSADADGFGRGEGAIALTLARLSDARARELPVLALIRGSAVNHDGPSSGITAPNGASQRKLLRAALGDAKLEPGEIDFVECHGTGTKLGDPIEVRALAEIYGEGRSAAGRDPLLLGAVKTNVGHLESAAGLAGIAKVLAAFERQAIPATLHTHPRNPHLDWDALEVEVVDAIRAWPRDASRVRRAGVSSFGLSGTNAHVILEEPARAEAAALPETPSETERAAIAPARLPILISARSEAALTRAAARLRRHRALAAPRLDLAASLATRRSHFEHRACILAPTLEPALAALEHEGHRARSTTGVALRNTGVTFAFTGQGSQRLAMGRDARATFPAFAASFDATLDRFAALGIELGPLLLDDPAALSETEAEAREAALARTLHTQPALFAVELALVDLLASFGVRPTIVLGHSIGEVAAACVAGVLSRDDACRLVAARARLMDALPPTGAMLSIEASEAEVEAALTDAATNLEFRGVEIAGQNGPRATVISGDAAAIASFASALELAEVRTERLPVSQAFHSAHVEPMLDEFRAAIASLAFRPASLTIVSTVDGRPVAPERLASPDYWVTQARAAVRFADAIAALEQLETSILVEIGPRGVLRSLAADCVSPERDWRLIPSLRSRAPEPEAIAAALGALHCAGVDIDWAAYFEPHAPRAVALPTYPFARERHWIELGEREAAAASSFDHPLLQRWVERATDDHVGGGAIASAQLSTRVLPYLADHIIHGHALLPATAMLELALAVGARVGLDALTHLSLERPLAVPLDDDDAVELQIDVGPVCDDKTREITIYARAPIHDEGWFRHASGRLLAATPATVDPELDSLAAWPPAGAEALELDGAYAHLATLGLAFGPSFRGLSRAWIRGDERFAEVELPASVARRGRGLHPALLDAALHVLVIDADAAVVPVEWSEVVTRGSGHVHAERVRVALTPVEEPGAYRLVIADERGEILIVVGYLRTRAASAADLDRTLARDAGPRLLELDWVAVEAQVDPEAELARAGGLMVVGDPDLAAALGRAGVEVDAHRPWLPSDADGPAPRWIVASWRGDQPLELARAALATLQAALIEPRWADAQIVIATAGGVAVPGAPDEDAAIDPAQAALWGLVRAAQTEHPERAITLVDLGADWSAVDGLPAALRSPARQLALRDRQLWTPQLRRPSPASTGATWQPDAEGTILITGGTGGLGSLVARALVERGARSLVLASRSGPRAPEAAALQAELEAGGATVELVACDLAHAREVAALVDHADRPDAPLRAVIHAAGVVADAPLIGLTPAALEQVFAAKVDGARHLDAHTRARSLDAFVLFSSIAGQLGAAGQANYAAANCYLDGLAERRRAEGLPGLAIAWGPWAEHGMAARLGEADLARFARLGLVPLTPAEGLALLDAALDRSDGPATVVAARFELGALRAHSAPLLRALVPTRAPSSTPAELASVRRAQPIAARDLSLDACAAQIQLEAAAVLSLDDPHDLDPDQPLGELGLDSLMAVELRNRLQELFAVRLPATLLFDHPTVAELAQRLLDELAELIDAASSSASAAAPLAPAAAVETPSTDDDDTIAIVAMACRYPGEIESPEQLWELLRAGEDAITPLPDDRDWPADLYDPDPDRPGHSTTTHGGFLHDCAAFDAGFFAIAPREAEAIDPQQRLLLESSWEALERGGIVPASLRGSTTGVFVGIMHSDYGGRLSHARELLEGYVGVGSSPAVASGRIAYTLGLQGPAITVDTACSSSLVAIHLACQSLRAGECELALAGGATVMATPALFVEFSRQRGLASDGRSKPFSAAADGVGWGEGVGVLVLERLADARAKGHPVVALIRGSAVNQDGRSQGLTAPNGPAQQRVIRAALDAAGLDASEVDVVEAHGTGTRLGDPVEAQAIQATYGRSRPADRPLRLGSVKSNIGHTQAAAGVAGVIKVALAMAHERLPRSLHAGEPSEQIAWNGSVELLAEAQPWPAGDRPRRAGVSSFGISGTNAHLIVEEPPTLASALALDTPARAPGAAELFVVSARDDRSLAANARRLRASLVRLDAEELELGPLADALARARTPFSRRAAIVAGDRRTLLDGLAQLARLDEGTDDPAPELIVADASRSAKLVFAFPGQGSQWIGMAEALMVESPAFRASLEASAAALAAHVPHTSEGGREWELLEVLRAPADRQRELLARVDVVQPVLFAVMVALAASWRALGVEPDAVVGSSQGEIAAAHVAGMLSLDDAARIVALRSQLIARWAAARPERGGMAAVGLSAEELGPWLARHEQLSLAVDAGPSSTSVSGPRAAIEALVAELEGAGIFARTIAVDYASHCPAVEELGDELLAALAGISPTSGQIPMLSSTTLERVAGPELDARYWYDNLRLPVRFAGAVEALLDQGHRLFVEVSPHPLLPIALEGVFAAREVDAAVFGTCWRGEADRARLLRSLAELHCSGGAVDWDTYFGPRDAAALARACAALPTYAFDRRRYWLHVPSPSPSAGPRAQLTPGAHPMLGPSLAVATDASTQLWPAAIDLDALPWLADHRVERSCPLPGAAAIELLVSAAREHAGAESVRLDALRFVAPVLLTPARPSALQVTLEPAGAEGWVGRISEDVDAGFARRSEARINVQLRSSAHVQTGLDAIRERCVFALDADEFRRATAALGLAYGPAFHGISGLWVDRQAAANDTGASALAGPQTALARVELPPAAGSAQGYAIHPALLDACLQTALAPHVLGAHGQTSGPLIPIGAESVELFASPAAGPVWAAVALRSTDAPNTSLCDLTIYDDGGRALIAIRGLASRVMPRSSADGGEASARDPLADSLLELGWDELSLPEPDIAARGPQRCVLLGGPEAIAQTLATMLRTHGVSVERVRDLDPCAREDVAATVEALLGEGEGQTSFVSLWALDDPALAGLGRGLDHDEQGADDPLAFGRRGWAGALHLSIALAESSSRARPRLVLVSHRAVAVAADGHQTRPEQALCWGLGGTIRVEQAGLRPLRVDLGAPGDDRELAGLVAATLAEIDDDQLAIRGASIHTARLERGQLPTPNAAVHRSRRAAPGEAYRVELGQPGSLDALELWAFERPAPGPGEVEIAVKAAGLNFRDVLLATGVIPPLTPEDRVRVGFECAGTITRVGPGVDGLAPGTRVVGLCSDGFATHVLADAALVAALPASLEFADAATLPVAQLSAYYGLAHVAGLSAGDKILIHSATGGVGLSALQWAQHVGAEVFATAGTETKRAWLREQGVAAVGDSRSLAFVDEVRAWTGGAGVDVVISALSGEAMRQSLDLVRPGGRFIELGLRDALADGPLGLGRFARGLCYALVNLGEMIRRQPAFVGELLGEVLAHVEAGALAPLPRIDGHLSEVRAQFWQMGRGRHIGKFVAHVDEPSRPMIQVALAPDDPRLSPAASYLISGGLGGLGLSLAAWMAEQGAGELVLLGRRGITRDDQREAIAAIEARGTRVRVAAVDVAERGALAALIAELDPTRPLRGIVHAAGVLDDATLTKQSIAKFERVMAAKVAGAWNLHTLSEGLGDALDFFVLYGSAASLLGSPGQANYVAANAFLDSLAHARRARGLPALCLSWGAFAEVGLAAAADNRGARLSSRGITALQPGEGVELFARLLDGDAVHVAPCPIDVAEWVEYYPEASGWPYLAPLLDASEHSGSRRGSDDAAAAFERSVLAASPIVARKRAVRLVIAELARVVRVAADELDPETPFADLGVDSLMGIELRNRVRVASGVELPATAIWTHATPLALAEFLVAELRERARAGDSAAAPIEVLDAPTPAPRAPDPQQSPVDEREVLDLDRDAAASALLAELDGLDLPEEDLDV